MFSVEQVLVSTVVGIVASVVVLFATARAVREPFDARHAAVLSLLVGLSILVWRLGANVPQLNDDPIPVTRQNDMLCHVVTYVVFSVYAGLRQPTNEMRARRDYALLTLVSLVVNIVTI